MSVRGWTSRTIVFDSSQSVTYCFFIDNESFKVSKSSMENPYSLFPVGLRGNVFSEHSRVQNDLIKCYLKPVNPLHHYIIISFGY